MTVTHKNVYSIKQQKSTTSRLENLDYQKIKLKTSSRLIFPSKEKKNAIWLDVCL